MDQPAFRQPAIPGRVMICTPVPAQHRATVNHLWWWSWAFTGEPIAGHQAGIGTV